MKELNDDQLAEINAAIEDGVDVTLFAKPEYSRSHMYIYRMAQLDGIDIEPYLNPDIDVYRLREIFKCVKLGYDVRSLTYEGLNRLQMVEIRHGFESNVDPTCYMCNQFDWKQMHEIRAGLESGVDVSVYLNPEFNNKQMQWIRWGLQEGFDVTSYAKPEISELSMQRKHINMLDKRQLEVAKRLKETYKCPDVSDKTRERINAIRYQRDLNKVIKNMNKNLNK